jgi:leucyl-tRNA synthetase
MWSLIKEGIEEHQLCKNSREDEIIRLYLHGCIKKVTEALEEHQSFNVAIAELMKLSNFLSEKRCFQGTEAYRESLEMLVRMLAPLAPHTASEMYEALTEAGLVKNDTKMDVHETAWPQYNPELLATANVKIVLQVQGKTRDTIFIPANLQKDKEEIYRLAMESKQLQKHLNGKTVRNTILVSPKKQGAHGLLNIITCDFTNSDL